MEYKHLLNICEQLLKHSALPLDMLEKYYVVKERILNNKTPQLPLQLIQLFGNCFNQMLNQKDLNITITETQINHIIDSHDANDLRTELSRTFQLLLQINSDRKEQDATIVFMQNEIRKLKLEMNICNSKLEQQKKLQSSEEKDRLHRVNRQMEDLRLEMQLKEEEYADKLHQLSFKYEEQIKTLMRKNQESDNSAELKSYEQFFDSFAELSLPYLEKYERDFEKFQSKNKKYNESISEKEILLDFLFYLLSRYVPEERRSSAKKGQTQVQPSPRKIQPSPSKNLHFEQYKSTNLDDTYNKLKQELEDSRRTLEKYELSKSKLQNQML